jgi:CubicO group peptidase (beta-lactamase class C family)
MIRAAQVLNEYVGQNKAPAGAVAQIANGRVVACRVIGARRPNVPFAIDSKVRVASISKLITGFCIHKLALEGRLDIDTDCSEHLGFSLSNPNQPDLKITARMVLSHTSGIRDGDNYQGKLGETLQSFFIPTGVNWDNGAHWTRNSSAASNFSYSNLGYGVLAQIVENITRNRFDLAAKSLILDKVGIGGGFNWSGVDYDTVGQSSPLYRRQASSQEWRVQVDGNPQALSRPTHNSPNGAPLSEYVVGTNGLLFSPQGGLRASITDLLRVAEILLGRTSLFSASQIERMSAVVWENANSQSTGSEREVFQSFGSGIHRIHANAHGPIVGLKQNLIGHYGEAYGLLGGVWVSPENQAGFAWFINGSLDAPEAGLRSSLYAVEENMMQACSEDLGIV